MPTMTNEEVDGEKENFREKLQQEHMEENSCKCIEMILISWRNSGEKVNFSVRNLEKFHQDFSMKISAMIMEKTEKGFVFNLGALYNTFYIARCEYTEIRDKMSSFRKQCRDKMSSFKNNACKIMNNSI